MKKKRNKLLMLMAILLVCTTGCSTDEEGTNSTEPVVPQPEVEHLVSFTKSDCKAVISSDKDYVRYVRDHGLEQFEYKALPDGQLQVKHADALFACSPEDIQPSVEFVGTQVYVTESQASAQAKEIGVYDLEYILAPFAAGDYALHIRNQQDETYGLEIGIHYTSELKGVQADLTRNQGMKDYTCFPLGKYVVKTAGLDSEKSGYAVAWIERAPELAVDSVWPCEGDLMYIPIKTLLSDTNRFPHGKYKPGVFLDILAGSCSLEGTENQFCWQLSEVEKPDYLAPTVSNETVDDFFNFALPKDDYSEEFFIGVPIEKDTCMVIDNIDELRNAYHGERELPEIDFSNHSLIIGKLYVTAGYYVNEQAVQNDAPVTLTLFLDAKSDAAITMMTNCYYWGIYPKLSSKNIFIQTFFYNDEQD